MIKILDPKKFTAGLFFLCLAALGLYLSTRYNLGTSRQMGPGYFPTFVACLLGLSAILAIVRSVTVAGEDGGMPRIAWPLIGVICGSVVAYGALIETLGLAPATIAMVLIAKLASRRLGWTEALLVAIGMSVFCSLVFVRWLGVPVTVFGPFL